MKKDTIWNKKWHYRPNDPSLTFTTSWRKRTSSAWVGNKNSRNALYSSLIIKLQDKSREFCSATLLSLYREARGDSSLTSCALETPTWSTSWIKALKNDERMILWDTIENTVTQPHSTIGFAFLYLRKRARKLRQGIWSDSIGVVMQSHSGWFASGRLQLCWCNNPGHELDNRHDHMRCMV